MAEEKGVATVRLGDGIFRQAEVHWYEAHGIGIKEIKIKFPFFDRSMSDPQFVVCLNNSGFPASLEVGKLYQIVPDQEAEKIGGLRVIDEDGEDYLYDAKMFFPLQLPPIVAQTLISTAKQG